MGDKVARSEIKWLLLSCYFDGVILLCQCHGAFVIVVFTVIVIFTLLLCYHFLTILPCLFHTTLPLDSGKVVWNRQGRVNTFSTCHCCPAVLLPSYLALSF